MIADVHSTSRDIICEKHFLFSLPKKTIGFRRFFFASRAYRNAWLVEAELAKERR